MLGAHISLAIVGKGIKSWTTSNEDFIWRPSKRSGWLHTYISKQKKSQTLSRGILSGPVRLASCDGRT